MQGYRNLPLKGDKHWCAPVSTYIQLPTTGSNNGDIRYVEDSKTLYLFDGVHWSAFSGAGGGGSGGASFKYIQTDTGTYPTALTPSDTLTLTSPTGKITIVGVASSDKIQFGVNLVPSDVALGNVNNTSDSNKPVSTLQQTALDLKVDKSGTKVLSDNNYTTAEQTKVAAIDQPYSSTEKTKVSNLPTDTNGALALKVDKVTGQGLSTNDYTTTDKTKLAGIATGATANSTDASLRDRSTHTGTQTSSTISDFLTAVLSSLLTGYAAGSNAVIAATDSILGALQKLQAQISANSSSIATNTTSITNKVDKTTTVNGHALSGNVVVTATDLSLDQVNNTSDSNKPVSTAQQTALNLKVDKVSGKDLSTNDYSNTDKSKVSAIDQVYSITEKNQLATNTSNIATKENSLGNPTANGQILSSTTAGSRAWINPPSGGGGGNPEGLIYGDGRHGNITLNTSQTLQQNYFFKNLIIPAGVVINTNGYVIRCSFSAVINGNLNNDGITNTTTFGNSQQSATMSKFGGGGGAGGVNSGSDGQYTNLPAGGVGGDGAKIGSYSQGYGNSNGISESYGGANLLSVMPGFFSTQIITAQFSFICNPGQGGGGGSGNGTVSGMGAGQGGGFLIIAAPSITGTGSITANGGGGGNGSVAGSGGGGGGGGGVLNLISKNDPVAAGLTITANGGPAGTTVGYAAIQATPGQPGQLNIMRD